MSTRNERRLQKNVQNNIKTFALEIEKLMDAHPPDMWTDTSRQTVLPYANEMLVLAVLRRKIKSGMTPFDAFNTTCCVNSSRSVIDDCISAAIGEFCVDIRVSDEGIIMTRNLSEEPRIMEGIRLIRAAHKNFVCADPITFDYEFSLSDQEFTERLNSLLRRCEEN